jgi:glycosyltransferase involved in cell wall biosynthesis
MSSNKKTKVIIIQKSFSDYRKGIFSRLNDIYNLVVLHSNTDSGVKQVETNYSKKIKKIKYANKQTAIYLLCLKSIISFKPEVIIHEFTPSILSIFPIILLKNFLGYKFILWGHGFNMSKTQNKNSIIYRVRKWLINRADAVLFYGDKNKDYIQSVIPANKYFVAYNALDTDLFQSIKKELDDRGIEYIKNELQIKYSFNIIFIGRLLFEKVLPEYFISIIRNLNSEIENLGVYIIGDGPAQEELNRLIQINKLNNIHLMGAIYMREITSKYLYIADLLLMPGYLGLSVNHAFSFATPVVSFEQGEKGPFHSPEVEYVKNKLTGYLAKNYDVGDLCDFVIELYKNKSLQIEMKKEINYCVENRCNINNMANGFVNAINYVTLNNQTT